MLELFLWIMCGGNVYLAPWAWLGGLRAWAVIHVVAAVASGIAIAML